MSLFDAWCYVAQGFGGNATSVYRSQGLFGHPGHDVHCGYGSPIKPLCAGRVYSMHHPDTPASDGYTAVYMICETDAEVFELAVGHVSEILCKIGDTVTPETIIAEEGNKGIVYQAGIRITLDMQKAGDKRGSHRHWQKRPVRKVRTTKPGNQYLQTSKGIYRDDDGYYYEVCQWWNGYNGCTDFTKPIWSRDLSSAWGFGSRGYDVECLQNVLIKTGCANGLFSEPTGYFGSLTKQALRRYQIQHKIAPSEGYFGPKTRAHFNETYKPI